MIRNSPILTSTAFGLTLVATLFFGLHPKDFSSHHEPVVSQDRQVSFTQYSIATTTLYLSDTHLSDDNTAEFSFDITLTMPIVPDNGSRFTVLFSIHDTSGYSQMLLGQWRSTLIVMSGNDYRNLSNTPRITASLKSVDGYVYPDELTISLEASSSVTSLTINDQPIKHNLDYAPAWKPGMYTVSLGNTPDRKQGWRGALSAFNLRASTCTPSRAPAEIAECNLIQTRSLNGLVNSMLADTTLSQLTVDTSQDTAWQIKPPFSELRAEWLSSNGLIDMKSSNFQKDVLINFFGFIPLALITFLYMSARYKTLTAIALTVTTATSVSLLIESIQTYIPSRTSSLIDLTVNCSAGVFSVLLCAAVITKLRRIAQVDTPQ